MRQVLTLFFDLANLEKEAGEDPNRFLKLLLDFYYNRLPDRHFKRAKLSLKGNSFILKPELLFQNIHQYDIYHVIQYIKLAGRRDYSFYKHYKSKSLQLSYYPDIEMGNIKHNPLLQITPTEIFFKFEEL